LSNNKHSLNPIFKHSQTILASRPVVVLVHKILNPNFPQISIFCHKCFCQHFILDQMIKCLPKSDLIKAFNFHHFRIQRINIKLILLRLWIASATSPICLDNFSTPSSSYMRFLFLCCLFCVLEEDVSFPLEVSSYSPSFSIEIDYSSVFSSMLTSAYDLV